MFAAVTRKPFTTRRWTGDTLPSCPVVKFATQTVDPTAAQGCPAADMYAIGPATSLNPNAGDP